MSLRKEKDLEKLFKEAQGILDEFKELGDVGELFDGLSTIDQIIETEANDSLVRRSRNLRDTYKRFILPKAKGLLFYINEIEEDILKDYIEILREFEDSECQAVSLLIELRTYNPEKLEEFLEQIEIRPKEK